MAGKETSFVRGFACGKHEGFERPCEARAALSTERPPIDALFPRKVGRKGADSRGSRREEKKIRSPAKKVENGVDSRNGGGL
jgi:hypothetical protein